VPQRLRSPETSICQASGGSQGFWIGGFSPLNFLCGLCVFARNKYYIFPGRLGGGRREKHYLSQRRKARKGNSKATARMFAGELSGPRHIDPGAAGAWALRETNTTSSQAESSGKTSKHYLSPRRKDRKERSKAKTADPEALRAARPDKPKFPEKQLHEFCPMPADGCSWRAL
jgi:hypothetical protein